ncbi:MAG TPA: hypothetical protein VF546_02165 [Pyrinomonadaceae bacterium]|jgi:hypothetical protein
MISNSSDFSLQELEARFEMQTMMAALDETGGEGGGYSGTDYGYYGYSWDNWGEGNGYVGAYQTASDGSGAQFDDGTYTDGSSGSFPAYDTQQEGDPTCPQTPCPPNPKRGHKSTICRCGG